MTESSPATDPAGADAGAGKGSPSDERGQGVRAGAEHPAGTGSRAGAEQSAGVFSTIEEAIEEVRRGRMVVVCDDEHRENEGDLTMAAQFATPEAINFMATHGRGLICLSLTAERCDELGLDLMAAKNESAVQHRVHGLDRGRARE